MDIKLSTHDIWFSTLIFGAMGVALGLPLVFLFKDADFKSSPVPVSLASALFWGVAAILAIFGFWDLYYKYIFPAYMRWLVPLELLLYGALGLGLWWLSAQLPGRAVVWFLLLGGFEGVLEHVFGIYGLHILDKVSWLQGSPPLPLLVFSFFEYIVYWALVGWLGFGILKIANLLGLHL